MNLLNEIGEILRNYSHHGEAAEIVSIPLLMRIQEKILKGEGLTFILPAFPAKSPSPAKTSGELPDMGEVLAMSTLQEICDKISSLYLPGARVILCSDGRVFSEVVKVSDESIDRYSAGIEEIIREFNLHRITTFSLDDLFPELKGDSLRDWLLHKFAKTEIEVKDLVKSDPNYASLFNGMHRFLLEDELVLETSKSKNQLSRETKGRAYELIRRSDAWSLLLAHQFKDDLRLSIHPYPWGHEKFGVKLVPSSNKWATPWHNVTVKIKNRFELMHLHEALKLNPLKKKLRDKYAYFEVANA